MKTPPASYFLKKAAKLKSGSKAPGKEKAGSITRDQVRDDRRSQDEGPQRRRYRRRDGYGRGLRPLHGPGSDGIRPWPRLESACKRSMKAFDRNKFYPLGEAVSLVKERAVAKFDETVEIAMNLGVDPRHADQMVRGVVNLPNGTGKTVRSPSSPAARRPTKPVRPVPMSSAPKT
jgi:hypothetical protein